MKKIKVKLKNQKYNIYCKKNLINDFFIIDFCKKIANNFVIITHTNLVNLYGENLKSNFEKAGLNVKLYSFENGEENKSRKTKENIEDKMLEDNFSKDTLIISLGGGIVSDISSFIAANFMRGIPYIIIPTTLLAMVDASIGGKGAINTKHGKNLIGTIYHPRGVFLDLNVLKTLADSEMKNGMSEMLKHSLINSKKSFYKLFFSDFITEDLIINSIKIKKRIIEKDENEKKIRKILNFGHTIAHAIEASLNFKISHGKALAFGLLVESYISYKMNFLTKKEIDEINKFLKLKKMIIYVPEISREKIYNFLKKDKKNVLGENKYSLLVSIGKSIINVEVLDKHLLQSLYFVFGGKIC